MELFQDLTVSQNTLRLRVKKPYLPKYRKSYTRERRDFVYNTFENLRSYGRIRFPPGSHISYVRPKASFFLGSLSFYDLEKSSWPRRRATLGRMSSGTTWLRRSHSSLSMRARTSVELHSLLTRWKSQPKIFFAASASFT